MSGVAPVPVFAPAVPKASSPLEGILEVCRELTVGFYFGTRLQASLPAWGALAGAERVPGALGSRQGWCQPGVGTVPRHCPGHLWALCLLLWPAAIWGVKRSRVSSLGWAVTACVALEWCLQPSSGTQGCPIPALPAPTHRSWIEQTSPRPMERFWFVGRMLVEARRGMESTLGFGPGLGSGAAAVWGSGGCVWEVLPCISGKGLQGGLQPGPSLES